LGANYKNAVQWFPQGRDRGVADSQYNLGILYARGIGVEQNLAESFKWFNLAAARAMRTPVANATISQSGSTPSRFAAANLAIQTFTPEPQPDDAVNVASPAADGTQRRRRPTRKTRRKADADKRTAAAH